MSTDLKFSLVTTIIVLGLIVASGLTAALHWCIAEGELTPSGKSMQRCGQATRDDQTQNNNGSD